MTRYINEAAVVHVLPNGLRIAMERLPHLHSATVGVWIKSGSANEQAHESGIAHFLEHLFFKGTKTRTTHELLSAVEGRGGHINAFTSREHTCLYVKMLDRDIQIGIEILADLLKNSLFSDWEKERNVILEEIASIEDTPDEYVHDLLAEHHWPNHPMGRPISGTLESVSQLTLEHVHAFHRAWYTPCETIVSIAGNFDEGAVLEQLRAEFEPLKPTPTPERAGPPEFVPGIHGVQRDIAQAHVCLAFPAPHVSDEQRYACDLASSILGGGSTSWLFEKIREEEGLAYSIYTFNSFHVTAGMLGVYAAVAPESYDLAMSLTFDALRRLRDEGVSAEELEKNRQQIKGNMLMGLESTSARMSRLAKSLLYYGRIVPIEEVLERLDAVTREEVRDYARRAFQLKSCTLTVLGPARGYDIEKIAL